MLLHNNKKKHWETGFCVFFVQMVNIKRVKKKKTGYNDKTEQTGVG